MRGVATGLIVSLFALLQGVTPGVAQESQEGDPDRVPDTHRGFWFSGGLGGGWSEGEAGSAIYIRMGGTPSSRFLIGGEVVVWMDDTHARTGRGNVTASGLWYPVYSESGDPGNDWFVKVGVGFANDDAGVGERDGLGLSFGTGYDFRLGNNFYLTPNVDFLLQVLEGSTSSMIVLTLGLGFH